MIQLRIPPPPRLGGRYLNSLPGIPAQSAFDALVRVYETFAARAPASGGTDPFVEAARRDTRAERAHGPPRFGRHTEAYTLSKSLYDVFWADPEGTEGREGRGWVFVLDLFNGSTPPVCNSLVRDTGDGEELPAECERSIWCEAGYLLHNGGSRLAGRHPWPGPDRDRWVRYCYEDLPKRWRQGSPPHRAGFQAIARPAGWRTTPSTASGARWACATVKSLFGCQQRPKRL